MISIEGCKDELDKILDSIPQLSPVVLYFVSISMKYLSGRYTETEFLNKLSGLTDDILEAGGNDESKRSGKDNKQVGGSE